MKGTQVILFSISILCCLLVALDAQAMSSTNYSINWLQPLTSGGGGESTSANYKVNVTVGQVAVGSMESTGYKMSLGFWAYMPGSLIYLPLILKQ